MTRKQKGFKNSKKTKTKVDGLNARRHEESVS